MKSLLPYLVLLAVCWSLPLAAQSPADQVIAEGIEAYRAERYEDALRAFEAATVADADNAEAHFLLARVLFDTPLRDEGRAGRSIARARELDPENLQYMVAQLQQLRTDTWNFFQEMLRLQERLALSQKILEQDPSNSFAHEELGAYYIRDFWRYRNALSISGLAFSSGYPDDQRYVFEDEGSQIAQINDPSQPIYIADRNPIGDPDQLFPDEWIDPGTLAMSDRLDLDALEDQGAPMQDLSARADRAYSRAIGHLETALASDPRRRPVYTHLMRLYALGEQWDEALERLSPMIVFFPEDVEMWQFVGLTNHRLGRDDAADVAFGEAMERMDTETRAVFEDISLLLPEEEQRLYREDPETVSRRFWTSENPRFLTPYNERRLEHHARLTYADLMYKSEDLDLPGWATERGKIHVRYGRPNADVVILGNFQNVLENYIGRGPGFSASAGIAEGNSFNIWDYGDFRFVFEDPSMTGEYRLYSPPADLFAATGMGAVERMDYEMIARQTFREVPERYDYQPAGRLVGLPYLITAFKGAGARTEVYVHYGIPIAPTFDPEAEDVVDVTVKTGAFLISEERDLLVERRRTLYGLNASQVESFEQTMLWVDTQPMEAPPGEHTVSVEFETVDGATAAVQRRDIEVPDFSGDDLALSSIMLAYLVEETDETRIPGLVIRNGLAIQPAPWSVFNHTQPIYLYFETYNLSLREGRNDYEVEAQLRPKDTSSGIARLARSIFGGGDRGVSTGYPVQTSSADDGQYVIFDVVDQEPGIYTLTLRITDRHTGQSVEEETDLYLE